MPEALIIDLETNGLLPELTTIHCLVAREENGTTHTFGPDRIEEGLAHVAAAPLLVGHNILGFDLPAIRKLYPGWSHSGVVRDTLVLSHMAYPEVKKDDMATMAKRPSFPKDLIGKHSLKAWGYRLGVLKGEFGETADWVSFSPEMLAYCVQDTLVTLTLWAKLLAEDIPSTAVELEQEFSQCIDRMMQRGFAFDSAAAAKLVEKLAVRRAEVHCAIVRDVPSFTEEYVTPKKQLRKTRTIVFNPNSRAHIARHLIERRGWKLTLLTDGGSRPQIDEDVLRPLAKMWPEAKLFEESFLLTKRLGQVAEGRENWLSKVKPDGRIHGYVNHNGCVTTRCTHSGPNMAQVPKAGKNKDGSEVSPYGHECRSLFIAAPGYVVVGADASGLELRCLAHYMGRYDHGEYARLLLNGDVHTANQKAAGLGSRDQAKTFIYALLYGAGDGKIGEIATTQPCVCVHDPDTGRRLNKYGCAVCKAGKALKAKFFSNTPALAKLRQHIEQTVKDLGYLRALDKRRLRVRSMHTALNTLLQSAGAVVMKKATVLTHYSCTEEGWTGEDVGLVAHVHDEMQLEAREQIAQQVGTHAVESIRRAGEFFGFRCPLAGEFKVGRSWADTH